MTIRHIRISDDVVSNATRRYTPSIEIPVFSWNTVATGIATPSWTPPYDIIITDALLSAQATATVGVTQVWVLKRNYLSPDPFFVCNIDIGSSLKSVKQFSGGYGTDLMITPYDNVYCEIYASGGHSSASLSLYGERARAL